MTITRGIWCIPYKSGARLISDVQKLAAAGVALPAPDPEDVAYAKRRDLTAEEQHLFAQGLTLSRRQGREINAHKLNRPAGLRAYAR